MNFEPKTEEQINAESLHQPGFYESEIYQAKDEVSKKGNDMIHLKLKVFADDGGFVFVDDYLLASLPRKLLHAAEACGLAEKYRSGTLMSQDFEGKCPKVKVGVQEDKTGQYGPKNVISDYIVREGNSAPAAVAPLDDEIPF